MFISIETYNDRSYGQLRDALEAEGFHYTGRGFEKRGRTPAQITTVQVLAPQRNIEIYFGPMGSTDRVQTRNMTRAAVKALETVLEYVLPEDIKVAKDHTSNPVDLKALLQ